MTNKYSNLLYMKSLNNILYKIFGIRIQKRQDFHKRKPRNNSMVWGFTPFDVAYKCRYYNDKFYSLNDGSEINNINQFIQI